MSFRRGFSTVHFRGPLISIGQGFILLLPSSTDGPPLVKSAGEALCTSLYSIWGWKVGRRRGSWLSSSFIQIGSIVAPQGKYCINIPILQMRILNFSSVQFSHSVVSDSLRPHELQHARPPCPSPTPRVHSNSRPSSRWCHPAISSSVVPFSSCPQSLPASESFPMSQLRCLNELSKLCGKL